MLINYTGVTGGKSIKRRACMVANITHQLVHVQHRSCMHCAGASCCAVECKVHTSPGCGKPILVSILILGVLDLPLCNAQSQVSGDHLFTYPGCVANLTGKAPYALSGGHRGEGRMYTLTRLLLNRASTSLRHHSMLLGLTSGYAAMASCN